VRVVVDTNVFVSALIRSQGASRAVIRACLQKRLQPLMAAALVAEYEALLGREELFERSPLSAAQREVVLNAFFSVCRWTRVYYRWRPNLRDEADNHLVELAVAGGAAVIVTKNTRDFRGAELQFPGLRVLKPERLLQEVREWER
jgi:putative PIN family toxin of toxin-antitoxin system